MNMQDSHDFVYMYVNICVLQFLFMSCKNNQQTKFIGWQVCMPRHITRTLSTWEFTRGHFHFKLPYNRVRRQHDL